MSYRIEVFTEHKAVALHAEGRFDLSLGFALWQFCRPEEGRYRYYLLDFARVSELCDSGLGWLRDFGRWAKRADASVHAVNVRPNTGKVASIPVFLCICQATTRCFCVSIMRGAKPSPRPSRSGSLKPMRTGSLARRHAWATRGPRYRGRIVFLWAQSTQRRQKAVG
jgi:hypothetical protein